MNFFINNLTEVILIIFPLLIYKELNIKNKYIFNLALIVSSLICILDYKSVYSIIYLNVIVDILLLKNYKLTYLLITFFTLSLNLNIFIEYLIIFILFFYKKNQTNLLIFLSIYFYTIIIFSFRVNYFYYLFSIIIYILCLFFINDYYFVNYEEEMEEKYSTYLFKFIHEVKNPLSVVLGYIEIINKKNIEPSKYIMTIEKEVRESLDIIEDYLMYGRFNVIFDYVDINLLLKDVYNDFKKLENIYNMDINFYYDEEEIFVLGDYSKLKQVIVNIIKNSIEAQGNKKLEIDIDYKIDNNDVIIEINDNGIGLENPNLIGEKYYTTKENGTGLGINFSKKIINLHKGNIKYTSNNNIGTNVSINLPLVYI